MIHALATAWIWNGLAASVCAAMLILYAAVLRFRFSARSILFVLGLVFIFLALASPLAVLADQYLLTAHVLQNLILLLIAPGLLVLGARDLLPPPSNRERYSDTPSILVRQAALGWLPGMATLALWQIPALFNAALQNPLLRITQQVMLLAAGGLFWWPVLGPRKSQRLPPVPWSAVYLFAACVVVSLLGLTLTYTSVGAYRSYFNPRDSLGILPLIRDTWRFSLETDQETGGILMWAGGCMILASTVMGLFVVWYNSPEVRDEFSPNA